jgi:hypothetical protein
MTQKKGLNLSNRYTTGCIQYKRFIIETSLHSCIINSFNAHAYISVAKPEKMRLLREA